MLVSSQQNNFKKKHLGMVTGKMRHGQEPDLIYSRAEEGAGLRLVTGAEGPSVPPPRF